MIRTHFDIFHEEMLRPVCRQISLVSEHISEKIKGLLPPQGVQQVALQNWLIVTLPLQQQLAHPVAEDKNKKFLISKNNFKKNTI